jgi:hypothetical protein
MYYNKVVEMYDNMESCSIRFLESLATSQYYPCIQEISLLFLYQVSIVG